MAVRAKPLPGHKFKGVQRWFEARCECGWRGAMHSTQGAMSEAVAEWHSHIRRCEVTTT